MDKIAEFIKSGEESLDIPMAPISEIEDVLKAEGFERGEYESNGWQVDFWYIFSNKEGIGYELSGSLWYGGFSLKKIDYENG